MIEAIKRTILRDVLGLEKESREWLMVMGWIFRVPKILVWTEAFRLCIANLRRLVFSLEIVLSEIKYHLLLIGVVLNNFISKSYKR